MILTEINTYEKAKGEQGRTLIIYLHINSYLYL